MSSSPEDESSVGSNSSSDGKEHPPQFPVDPQTGHIVDRGFPSFPQAVRKYYRKIQTVYTELDTLGGEYPTIGFATSRGWYHYEDAEEETSKGDWTSKARVKRFTKDWEEIIGDLQGSGRDREIFNITSWKRPEAIETYQFIRQNDNKNSVEWKGDQKIPPGYESLRGCGFWCDLDLADKAERATLTDNEISTIEAALQCMVDLVAELYDVSAEAIYALDSGGGAYVYGPPEATLPVAEYFDDEEERRIIFDDLTSRMNEIAAGEISGVDGLWPTVVDDVDDADELLDPDFIQNRNRQSKAPGAIHHSHDVVVTPLRRRDPETYEVVDEIDYRPTLVSSVDDDTIEQLETWSAGLTTIEHKNAVSTLVRKLYPELANRSDAATWQDILEVRLEALQRKKVVRQQRETAIKSAIDDYNNNDSDADRPLAPKGVLEEVDITTDRAELLAAIDSIDVREVVQAHALSKDGWDTSSRPNEITFNPTWRRSDSGKSCAIPDKEMDGDRTGNLFIDNGCDGVGGPVKAFALGKEIMPQGQRAAANSLTGYWGETLDKMRKAGYHIPIWVPEADDSTHDYTATPFWAIRQAAVSLGVLNSNEFVERESSTGDGTYKGFPDAETWNEALAVLEREGIDHGREQVHINTNTDNPRYPTKECVPPSYDSAEFDPQEYWNHLQESRYADSLDNPGPVIWHDPPGTGKTTNVQLAAEKRDDNVAMLFRQHKKAREFIIDDVFPDEFDPFHLKGGEQKRDDICMMADHNDEDCPTHGHTSVCPSMCPIYDRDPQDSIRRRYDALARTLGDTQAHLILGDELSRHDEAGECNWFDQFDQLESADHVVGVHEYQMLSTVCEGRQVVIDETPASLLRATEMGLNDLADVREALEEYADSLPKESAKKYTAQNLVAFVSRLIDVLADSGASEMETLDPPSLVWDADESYDPAAGHFIKRIEPDEEWQNTEALTQIKIGYTEMLIRQIERDDWDGASLNLNPIFAAASSAGLPTTPVRKAIAAPNRLDICPWCNSKLDRNNGRHCCLSDGCEWDEEENGITRKNEQEARGRARLEERRLVYESLPLETDLPQQPIILDATATPEKICQLYSVGRDDITIFGNEPLRANMRITQLLSGQYHSSTITNAITSSSGEQLPREEWSSPAAQIQDAIDKAGRRYKNPLFIMKKQLHPVFDIPDNAETLHYHATRGLNREQCDAVFCVGGPHANLEDLEHQAELLALGDEVRVGGQEHSTRQGETTRPPIYRKLIYADDRGRGRAVATKHLTGLIGALFREGREKELEQAVHRARPLLADDTVDVFLLTNIPTALPIDYVCSLNELTASLTDALPLRGQALDLLAVLAQIDNGEVSASVLSQCDRPESDCLVGTAAEYTELANKAGIDVGKRQIRNYLYDLAEVGLISEEGYEYNRGRLYRTELAASKTALRITSHNGFFEADTVRRLAALARSDAAIDLVAALQEELEIALPSLDQSMPTDTIQINGNAWTVSASCETKLNQISTGGVYATDLASSAQPQGREPRVDELPRIYS